MVPGIIVLRANFGDAEFRPAELKDRDFQNGVVVVNVLPRGAKKSLVIEAKGVFETIARPMVKQ
jgi:hypothetical protein